MPYDPPKIDARTETDVEVELVSKLNDVRALSPDWADFEPGAGLSGAMIGIFGRLAEIVIRRLNGVPEKNFLAFLDLLGASPLPPQPARVPLTFTLAAGSTADSVVPEGTQVAAPPAEGEKEPVTYETERELVVTAARLDSVFVSEPAQDRYADRSAVVTTPSASGAPAFAGNRRTEHVFYVGHASLFGMSALKGVRLRFTLASNVAADSRVLRWEIWDGASGVPVNPSADTTAGLTRSGEVTFGKLMPGGALTGAPNATLTTNSPFPLLDVGGTQSRWLRCRLVTPVTPSSSAVATMVRESQLPTVTGVGVSVEIDSDKKGLAPDAAFSNTVPLDTTKDFMPFGAAPKYGDAFYIADRESLARAGASITLNVAVSDPAAMGATRAATASADLKLRWEYWDGSKWAELATTDKDGKALSGVQGFNDTTKALTANGAVTFPLPASAAPTTVNGTENAWVRARIVSGNYGTPAHYDPVYAANSNVIQGYTLTPATLAPPSLSSVSFDYSLQTPEAAPDALVTYNDFSYAKVPAATAFKPFAAVADDEPTLYIGFSLPAPRTDFPNRKLSLYVGTLDFKHGRKYGTVWPRRSTAAGAPGTAVYHKFWFTNETSRPARFVVDIYGTSWSVDSGPTMAVAPGASAALAVTVNVPVNAVRGTVDRGFIRVSRADEPGFEHGATFETYAAEAADAGAPQLAWEYWDGNSWETLVVRDDSRALTAPGLVEFLAPGDFAPHEAFGLDRFWLRVRWKSGAYDFEPRIERLLPNTTTASQTVTVRDEVLGTSDASKHQKFRTTRAPVLPGEWLEVREPELPSSRDAAAGASDSGGDLVRIVKDSAGLTKEIWVRWAAVPDFYSSGPRDRHYVLDRMTGDIEFGDGLNGMIPPALAGNLRMIRYQTGGGSVGNRPAGVVTQLKTTVPYIDKVTNHVPATGGADAEDSAALVERAPRTLRHGGRAVTVEDYEDLSKLASPEVARAKCVPLYDLAVDPDATTQRLGFVSVIVIPRSSEPMPVPSLELLGRVRDYLDQHRSANADISVVGPDYVRVDVAATVGVGSLEGAQEIERAVTETLSRFLHPLTGGLEGKGWDFGRRPHKSDLYALLEKTPGVDHVISLGISETKERADATTTERFLVYSGTHKISLTLEPA